MFTPKRFIASGHEPSQVFDDKLISWKAKGIYLRLFSGSASASELSASGKDGIESVRSGIQELVSRGYIVLEKDAKKAVAK